MPELIAKNKVAAENFKAACLATQLRLKFHGAGDELIQVVQKRGKVGERGAGGTQAHGGGLGTAGTQ